MWKKIKPYVISIAIALAVGALSALLTRNNMNVYDTLTRPALSPPMWVFPVVWTILFILMGISAAMVYCERDNTDVSGALKIYALQLIVNFFWSIIFFNLQAYLFAVVWLGVLLLLILLMIISFYRIRKAAAYLQLPYLAWSVFAFYLTLMIYILN